MKDKALNLLASKMHCVISTVGPNEQPQSAMVGYSEDDSLRLLFGTPDNSRKLANIYKNPKVSVVVADEEQKLEVQYEGIATICKAEEIKDRLEVHFIKLPVARKRLDDPRQVWVLVEPSWIRYVDLSDGYKFEELRQFS